MLIPLSYNVRSLFVRKATTIATALGIGLVVFVLSSALMLARGIKNTLVSNGSSDRAMILRKGSDTEMASGVDSNLVSLVMAAPGVKRGGDGQPLGTADVVVVIAMDKLGAGEGMVSNILVRGVSPNVMAVRPEVRVIEGRPARPGTDEVIIGKGVRGNFKGLEIGSGFELKKNRPVQVVGVFESGGSSFESEVWVDIETARTSFGRGSSSNSVTVALESPSAYDGFAAYIENDKQLGLEPFKESVYYEKQSEGTSIFITALGVFISVLFAIGAMIGAMITMYGAVSQRSKEVGTLRALGFSRFAVMLSFLIESSVLALVGGVIGGVASMGMTAVKFSMMNFATWQEISFSFDASPAIIAGSIVAGAMMGVFGGIFPGGPGRPHVADHGHARMSFVPKYRVVESPGARASALVLHGALGSGQNWTRFIQRLVAERPDYRYVLVDLRHHGGSQGAPPPNTLRACAEDLVALGRALGAEPEVVIGHSFGGKVAVEYARQGSPQLQQVWVLDAVMGAQPEHETGEIAAVMRAVRSVPMPAQSRRDVVEHLHERVGLSKGLSEWMTTNLRRAGERYEWTFDLDAIAELMADYFRVDLWSYLSEARPRPEFQLVVAERSDRWTPELRAHARALPAHARVLYHELPNSGHWVHVDNPDGLLQLLAPALPR